MFLESETLGHEDVGLTGRCPVSWLSPRVEGLGLWPRPLIFLSVHMCAPQPLLPWRTHPWTPRVESHWLFAAGGALPGCAPPARGVLVFVGLAASESVGIELGPRGARTAESLLGPGIPPLPPRPALRGNSAISKWACFWLPFAVRSVFLGTEGTDFTRCCSDRTTVVPAAAGVLGVPPHPVVTCPSTPGPSGPKPAPPLCPRGSELCT